MKSFKQYLKEAQGNKTLYFTFGRFDPPTQGHSHLFNILKVQATTNHADAWLIFPSRTTDYKKTFLTAEERVDFLKKLNPRYADHIIDDSECRTVIDIMNKYQKLGFNKYILIVGNSDVAGMNQMSKHAPEGTTMEVPIIPELKRDDSDGVQGMSSSKLKKAIVDNDKDTFIQGIGNAQVAEDMWEILEPYKKYISKYVTAKDKLK